jgi:hypothetical protein
MKVTRRERLFLVVCAVVILATLGYYLGVRQIQAVHARLDAALEERRQTLESYARLLARAERIEAEHAQLAAALKASDALFMRPQAHGVAESKLISQLAQLEPALNLSSSGASRGLRGRGSDRVSVRLNGVGTLDQIATFLHRVETFRPALIVDNLSLSVRGGRRARKPGQPVERDAQIAISVILYALMESPAEEATP